MECPRCGAGENHLETETGSLGDDFLEIELRCDICDDITAFYRIHDKDWLPTLKDE
jgi:hypothetical protein